MASLSSILLWPNVTWISAQQGYWLVQKYHAIRKFDGPQKAGPWGDVELPWSLGATSKGGCGVACPSTFQNQTKCYPTRHIGGYSRALASEVFTRSSDELHGESVGIISVGSWNSKSRQTSVAGPYRLMQKSKNFIEVYYYAWQNLPEDN